ncbi:hypothetical protein AB0L63_04035 [Nocardia sp. NPDC051990]|uniref:hypothetical protein n=1 Tax=Nocardia sp. NPDC051990 TaxID=3155285 RepID=UPI003416CF29
MTTPTNTVTRRGKLEIRGVRHDPPDAGKIAKVLVELAREQMADKPRRRDDRTAISGESSPLPPAGPHRGGHDNSIRTTSRC